MLAQGLASPTWGCMGKEVHLHLKDPCPRSNMLPPAHTDHEGKRWGQHVPPDAAPDNREQDLC